MEENDLSYAPAPPRPATMPAPPHPVTTRFGSGPRPVTMRSISGPRSAMTPAAPTALSVHPRPSFRLRHLFVRPLEHARLPADTCSSGRRCSTSVEVITWAEVFNQTNVIILVLFPWSWFVFLAWPIVLKMNAHSDCCCDSETNTKHVRK
jgi:hypothetical protein